MKEIEIIDNGKIPIPSRGGARSELGKRMAEIKMGDPPFKTNANVNTFHSLARYWGKQIVYRRTGVDGNGIWHRIWCIGEKRTKQTRKPTK